MTALGVADGTAVTATGEALDLHEGICDPRAAGGCLRWPEHYRLRSSLGEVVMGRCRATNLCHYCRIMAVVETAEMLWLDAAEYAPELWVVLTAREHLTRKDTHAHLRQLRRAAKKQWPDTEWHVQVEFQKRGALHLNLLIKGVPAAEGEHLLDLLSDRWCSRVDALPQGQHIEALSSAEAVVRYLQKELSHGLKREQAPPLGWKGHRTSQTRGYLVRPASVMRQEARESLARKRALHKATKVLGLNGPAAEAHVEQDAAQRADTEWQLWQLPGTGSGRIGGAPVGKGEARDRFRQVADENALVIEYRRLLADLPDGPGEQLRMGGDAQRAGASLVST